MNRKRILCIDDSSDTIELIRLVLKKALRKAGLDCDFQGRTTGQEGIEWAHQNKPDLILLDERLPNMGGWEVLERIRPDNALKNVDVIMLGRVISYRGDLPLRTLNVPHVDAWLLKPLDPRELINTVCRLLNVNREMTA